MRTATTLESFVQILAECRCQHVAYRRMLPDNHERKKWVHPQAKSGVAEFACISFMGHVYRLDSNCHADALGDFEKDLLEQGKICVVARLPRMGDRVDTPNMPQGRTHLYLYRK